MAGLSKSELEHNRMAGAITALSMDAVQQANSGHPGMPMGMADGTAISGRAVGVDGIAFSI